MNENVRASGLPDEAGRHGSPPSPVLALLRDLVPAVGDALLIGRVAAQVAHHASGRMSSVTVLLREGDPLPPLPVGVSLLVGDPAAAMRGMTQDGEASRFTLVMLVDGLDYVDVAGQPETLWADRLEELAGLVAPGGCLVVGVEPESPAFARTGTVTVDAPDPTRPASPGQLRRALAAVGQPGVAVHCGFGPRGAVTCVLAEDLAGGSCDGDVPSSAVAAAIRGGHQDEGPLSGLAFEPLARAGLIPMLASGWIAVAGGSGRAMYVRLGDGATAAADRPGPGQPWEFEDSDTGQPAEAGQVPNGPSLESSARVALARSDLTSFRQIAEEFGAWVRAQWAADADRPCVALDQLHRDEHRISPALGALGPPPLDDVEMAIAWAWLRFDDRVGGQVIGAWEQWSTRSERVIQWVEFSGVADARRALGAAERPAARSQDAVDPASPAAPAPADPDPQRTLIGALREAVRVRDTQLSHREQTLRRLRAALLAAEEEREAAQRELADILGSRAYRTGIRLEAARNHRELRRALAVRGARLNDRISHVARQVR